MDINMENKIRKEVMKVYNQEASVDDVVKNIIKLINNNKPTVDHIFDQASQQMDDYEFNLKRNWKEDNGGDGIKHFSDY